MLPYIIAGLILFFSLSYYFFLRPSNTPTHALNPKVFQSFTLIDKTQISPDSYIFNFALQSPTQILGLPIGQHITIKANTVNINGNIETVQHPYTPITGDETVGRVEFLIKIYKKNENIKFPHGGRLSQHLLTLPLGAAVEMRGPVGKFIYLHNGRCVLNNNNNNNNNNTNEKHVNTFVMIAGGTGITPMMQIIRAILKNKEDFTQIYLVYSNHSEKDILLREELDAAAQARPTQIHVWYTITRETEIKEKENNWKYSFGRINEEILREHIPVLNNNNNNNKENNNNNKNESVLALMCGPAQMIQSAVKPNLEKLGYTTNDMFTF